jgi:hypothetical protein
MTSTPHTLAKQTADTGRFSVTAGCFQTGTLDYISSLIPVPVERAVSAYSMSGIWSDRRSSAEEHLQLSLEF